jgi:hypothetical protein
MRGLLRLNPTISRADPALVVRAPVTPTRRGETRGRAAPHPQHHPVASTYLRHSDDSGRSRCMPETHCCTGYYTHSGPVISSADSWRDFPAECPRADGQSVQARFGHHTTSSFTLLPSFATASPGFVNYVYINGITLRRQPFQIQIVTCDVSSTLPPRSRGMDRDARVREWAIAMAAPLTAPTHLQSPSGRAGRWPSRSR